MKIVLRYLLIKKYEEHWNILLLKIEYILNIVENVLTFIIFFEFFYKVKFKTFLSKIISNKDSAITNFIKFKKIIRNEIFDIIKFI